MYHSLYDPSVFDDDKLVEKIAKCREMLAYHVDRGNDSLVDSTRAVLEALEYESTKRQEERVRDYNEELKERRHEEDNIYIGRIKGVDPDDPKEMATKNRPLDVKRRFQKSKTRRNFDE